MRVYLDLNFTSLEAVYENTTKGRDPKHLIEDVVEENANEFDPHASFYDGNEEFPSRTEANCAPGDQTALVLAPPTRFHTMAVVPGDLNKISMKRRSENYRTTKPFSFANNFFQLPPGPLDNNDKVFDDHMFKLGLSLSVLIFLFLLEAHHYTPLMSARQLYITYLSTAICLDLVDNIYFLDLLWQSFKDGWNLPLWLDVIILTVASVNFVMPTFALLKLRFGRYPRFLYISDKIWSLIYVLIVNLPFLGLRIYLYVLLEVQQSGRHYDFSLFAVKNVAVIYLAMRELWTRLQYWRMKRKATGSRGE
ncbi:unnamed protein product, partial [Strongylus vulgaris]